MGGLVTSCLIRYVKLTCLKQQKQVLIKTKQLLHKLDDRSKQLNDLVTSPASFKNAHKLPQTPHQDFLHLLMSRTPRSLLVRIFARHSRSQIYRKFLNSWNCWSHWKLSCKFMFVLSLHFTHILLFQAVLRHESWWAENAAKFLNWTSAIY